MRTVLMLFGIPVVLGATFVLLYAAGYIWLFRDGMAPGVVPSTGGEALRRFWSDFRVPFFYFMPALVAGLICLWLTWPMERKAVR